MNKKVVLVTGGAGYIGSHTCVELLNNGHDIIVLDNFSNSNINVIDSIKEITKKDVLLYNEDICNKEKVDQIFSENKIDCVIHFAGYKSIEESTKEPLLYYNNNVYGTIVLLEAMKKANVKNLIFSSSATVYGIPKAVPIKEDFEISSINPYGRTKVIIEQMLTDIYEYDNDWSTIILRYFNPVGAHESYKIGEIYKGEPKNLMPNILEVASNSKEKRLFIYGNDYKTKDGTGVRDYIHVVDLAKGHIAAFNKIDDSKGVFEVYNLGTGIGYSVLEIVNTFSKVNNVEVPYVFKQKRKGDVDYCYADITKVEKELGWHAELNLEKMCYDAWEWKINK